MLRTRRTLRTAMRALPTSVLVLASVAVAPAPAAEPLPAHWCTVNGEEAPPGSKVEGTPGPDTILCEGDVQNVIVWGGGGNDKMRVKGLVVDASVLGGEGADTIQVNNLFPRNADSMVRGGGGDDTIITALVVGTAEHGATVHGDHGDDEITTGAVQGYPGTYKRGGGQVFGNDGNDVIRTSSVDIGGRVVGGSENDLIEPKSLGTESSGTVQGGPGDDVVQAQDGGVLTIGPGWAMVDGGPGTDDCRVKHASEGERIRSSVAACP
ncbi:hypothetical protein QIS99_07430 [Streptomyces sp. B-S-A8]|uniref:Calcium-binding protein n=1 Tax=Streptomyces solicavernae TaxID=3043614 RepID=A0ABT6RP75_9ACTN|nr:hypothetical protein [Streptomyces sp. B-S-A8]MDI3386049.1 hypothetical protein [Streptomyces sp. B-S-A8]